jgi:MoaA/NifB/PqqE/SkfB family radical SAM enzyme
MPNVFITNICNLNCKYCFAKGMLGDKCVNEFTMSEIKQVASFLKVSQGCPKGKRFRISILGGEPTLHSKFDEMIDFLIREGFIIVLFSNGTFPERVSDYLKHTPPNSLNIILNMNHRDTYTSIQWKNVERNLKTLNNIISLGFTIYQKQFDYSSVLEYIKKYDLKKEIRLGISLPIVNGDNTFVPYDDFKEIGRRIVEFSAASFKNKISFGLDCGFIVCMFNREQLGILQLNNVNLNFLCDGAIDIGKNGRIWRCFPLYSIYNTNLDKFDSVNALKEYYDQLLPVKKNGISGNCGNCKHFIQKICSGGCYGFEFIQH